MIDEWNLSKEKRRLRREDNPYICDFSRGGLNVRLRARIQTLLRGHKYDLFIFQQADLGWIWGIKQRKEDLKRKWRETDGFRLFSHPNY